ncbi:hypothetical protein C0J52_00761 [Blattella germanica]|nr:hypothetical protein C0J52_00761 [Blattella germanica]
MLSLVSPLVAGGLYFCLNLPVLRHRKESGELSLSGSLTAGGLLVLCATILAAYLVWVISTMHHHIKAWHSWWTRSNLVTSISWIQGAHGKGKNNLARPNTAASHDWRIQERKTTTYNNNRNNVHCTTKYRNK